MPFLRQLSAMLPAQSSPSNSLDPAAAIRLRPARKWHHVDVYFLLAMFNLLTVALSLAVGHQLADVFSSSVEVNRQWSDRQQVLTRLGTAAAAVNAPGNDVFESRDVNGERARLVEAAGVFRATSANVRQDLVRLEGTQVPSRRLRFSTHSIRKSAT